MSCASRFIVSHTKRYIIRLTPFIMQYIFVNLPIIYRFLYFYHRPVLTSVQVFFSFLSSQNFQPSVNNSSSSANSEQNSSYFKYDSDIYYLIQTTSATLCALLYTTHIPERLWPDKFDIVGQSHQIFHLMAFVCTWSQFIALRLDMKHLVLEANMSHYKVNDDEFYVVTDPSIGLDAALIPFTQIKLTYTFVIALSLFFNCIILVHYYFKAVYFNPWLNNGEEKLKNGNINNNNIQEKRNLAKNGELKKKKYY